MAILLNLVKSQPLNIYVMYTLCRYLYVSIMPPSRYFSCFNVIPSNPQLFFGGKSSIIFLIVSYVFVYLSQIGCKVFICTTMYIFSKVRTDIREV